MYMVIDPVVRTAPEAPGLPFDNGRFSLILEDDPGGGTT